MKLQASEALAIGMIERVVQASVLATDLPSASGRHLRGLSKAARLYYECRQYDEVEQCCTELRKAVEGLPCEDVVHRVLDEWVPRLMRSARPGWKASE